MKDAQKPDHASLGTIINWLKDGRFVIPDFQRDFEWRPWDIRELMKSIFLDYYIGSLLLWKGKRENFDALSCEPIYGHKSVDKRDYIVLDGQQRLTALYYVFIAPEVPLPNKKNRFFYFVSVDKFMNQDDDAFGYDWLKRRWAKVLDNEKEQYEKHIFPFSIIGKDGFALSNWAQNYQKYWQNKVDELEEVGDLVKIDNAKLNVKNAETFGQYVNEIINQYQISYIELDQDMSVPKVCDIFAQVNSRGIPLDVFDLMNAMLKPKDIKLKSMWRESAPRLAFVDTKKMNVYALQVMSILQQNYCSPKYLYHLIPGAKKQIRESNGELREETLIENKEIFAKYWGESIDSLEDAIDRLRNPQEFGAISSRYLPYASILPVFSSLQVFVKSLPGEQQFNAQQKIRHWYWASIFTSRYSGAVESISTRDFQDVKQWINNGSDEPGMIQEFKNGVKNIDLRKETKRGSSIYNGIFNLFVIKGALDLRSARPPYYKDLDDHHIVPKSKSEMLGTKEIDTILNRTPLTAYTNRHVISDRWPNEYLTDLIGQIGRQKVEDIMGKHFITPNALDILLKKHFNLDDFNEFIQERERVLRIEIENLLK